MNGLKKLRNEEIFVLLLHTIPINKFRNKTYLVYEKMTDDKSI